VNPDPNDPNKFLENPPDLRAARNKSGKEWLLVYGFVIVLVVIIALTAWHLMQGR
jgi:hypothetical protein